MISFLAQWQVALFILIFGAGYTAGTLAALYSFYHRPQKAADKKTVDRD